MMFHPKEGSEMERIELFDQYIAGALSQSKIKEFNKRLEEDERFASDFEIYLLSVRGICDEAEQEDIEFYHAMKSLSKDQLQAIIGEPKRLKAKLPHFRGRMAWILSMAAMLVVFIGIGWNMFTTSQNQLCDVVYACSYRPIECPRSDGREYVNLNNLTNEELMVVLPEMELAFDNDTVDTQDWHIDGMNLVMAYLKLYRKHDAVRVLEEMSLESSTPEEYVKLLNLLK